MNLLGEPAGGPTPAPAAASAAEPAEDPEAHAPMAQHHPLRILLVEDHAVNQKVAMRLLRRLGYRADLAGNGLEAIQGIERQPYDVVLMDVQMPEMDGLEATRRIVARWPAAQRPRIVAVTANALQADRELCLAAGMDDHLAKPMRLAELRQALARCPSTGPQRPASRGHDAPVQSAGAATVAGPAITASPAIDPVVYRQLQADTGSGFVAGLVDAFAEEAPPLLAELRAAWAEHATDRFKSAAHALKSGGRTFGALQMAELARALELGGPPAIAEPIEALAAELERSLAALKELAHG